MQLFAAIDFETSSSERNSACSIGYVIFNQSKIIKKQSYLIKPPKPEIQFTEIHGLTWDMLKKEKTFDKVWKQVEIELLSVDYFSPIMHPLIDQFSIRLVIIIILTFLLKSSRIRLF